MPTIVIVGGGASGAVLAAHLLRYGTSPLTIRILEPRAVLGQGVAYSTAYVSHLLNVRAGDMSAFRNAPDHFVEWLRGNIRADADSDAFASRVHYGAYLQHTLGDAGRRARPDMRLEHVRAKAQRVSPLRDGFEIATDDGRGIRADNVVLALGNSHSRLNTKNETIQVANAWSANAGCRLLRR